MRINLKSILPFMLMGTVLGVFGQSSFPFDEQYFISEGYLINPSLAGSEDDIVLKASHRRQFQDLEGPVTTIASAHANVVDRVGVGLYFLSDEVGNTTTNSFNLGVAYHIPIGDSEKRQDGQFSFGSSLSFAGIHFDGIPENINDPLYVDETAVYIPYVNFGGSVSYKGWFLGISALDIPLSYNSPIVNQLEPSPTYFYGNLAKELKLTSKFMAEPSVAYRVNKESQSFLDLNLKLSALFNESSKVWIGGQYRMDFDDGDNEALRVSPAIGADVKRFNFAFSYNIGLTDLASFGGDGFTVSLGYDLENFFNPQFRKEN